MDLALTPELKTLLDAERSLLERLRTLLGQTDAPAQTLEQLGGLIDHLDALFLIVVVGEFNAGKSSVLNALFGEKIMEEGPIPTTAKITILRYGDEPLTRHLSEYLIERRHPAPLLRYLNLVDTPGTNSIIQRHQQITEDFIPRADLVLFITSFDRPLADSERRFLLFIREAWGKRLTFVLNKADLAADEDSLRQVIEHIQIGTAEVMEFEPRIFPVSAKQAYASRLTDDPAERAALWTSSRFAAFEDYLTKTLAGPRRLAMKLNAPLDTAARLLDLFTERLADRMAILTEDEATLDALGARLTEARTTLANDYARHLAEIDTLLLEMERRGVQFLDDTLRVSKISLLRDRDRFKEEFLRQVVRQTDRQIEDRITEAVDTLLKQALSLWNETLHAFRERLDAIDRRHHLSAPEAFDYNRAEVFAGMMREAGRKIETYDLREEARRILENAREASTLFQYTEAGAIGLGALAGLLALTTTLDALGGFGLLTAGALALTGFTYLPRQRRKATQQFRQSVEQLRTELRAVLTVQFDREIEGALGKIRETTAPYAGFVAGERTVLTDARAEHADLLATLADLRQAVHTAVGASDDD